MWPKMTNSEVVFREFPDEVTLAINLSGCPFHCKDCHSPWLQEHTGEYVTPQLLNKLIKANPMITCVGLMGGDGYYHKVEQIARYLFKMYPHLKLGWYSGRETRPYDMYTQMFTYVKYGPYIPERGPLDNPNTNQRMYFNPTPTESDNFRSVEWIDITHKFWRENQ